MYLKVSVLLLKLPVHSALKKTLMLSSYVWLFCDHGGPNQFKASSVRISMEIVPQAKGSTLQETSPLLCEGSVSEGTLGWGTPVRPEERGWVRHFVSAGQLKKIPLPKAMTHAFLWLRNRYVQELQH